VVTLTYAPNDSPEWEALAMVRAAVSPTQIAEMSANSPLEIHADQGQWGLHA